MDPGTGRLYPIDAYQAARAVLTGRTDGIERISKAIAVRHGEQLAAQAAKKKAAEAARHKNR